MIIIFYAPAQGLRLNICWNQFWIELAKKLRLKIDWEFCQLKRFVEAFEAYVWKSCWKLAKKLRLKNCLIFGDLRKVGLVRNWLKIDKGNGRRLTFRKKIDWNGNKLFPSIKMTKRLKGIKNIHFLNDLKLKSRKLSLLSDLGPNFGLVGKLTGIVNYWSEKLT